MASESHKKSDEGNREPKRTAGGRQDSGEHQKMGRSEAGAKGGHSESHEEHARGGSQSHKNDNR